MKHLRRFCFGFVCRGRKHVKRRRSGEQEEVVYRQWKTSETVKGNRTNRRENQEIRATEEKNMDKSPSCQGKKKVLSQTTDGVHCHREQTRHSKYRNVRNKGSG